MPTALCQSLKMLLGFFVPRFHRPLRVGWGTLIDARSKITPPVHIGRYCRVLNCQIDPYVQLFGNCRLQRVEIGSFSYLNGPVHLIQVKIGRFCSIGPYTRAGLGEHPSNWVSSSPAFFSKQAQCGITFSDEDYYEEMKPITLGNDVWIGANVYMRGGITVGHGAIVAAGAVVVKDVAPYTVVGGVPARTIRSRFCESDIKELLALQWWDWDIALLRQAAHLFRKDSPTSLLQWARERGLLLGRRA